MTLNQYYNYLIDYQIASEEALNLLTSINGYNEDTLNDALYCLTGYRDIEQYTEYEDIETYNEYFNEEEDEEEE